MNELLSNSLFGNLLVITLLIVSVFLMVLVVTYRRALRNAEMAAQKRAAEFKEQTAIARSAAQAKGDFLSRMSHEIRTPLHAIIGLAHIAQHAQDKDQILVSLAKVEANSRHLLEMVNDILDFSKLESGKMELEKELFSLKENITFVASMFCDRVEEKHVKFSVNIKNVQHDGVITDSLRLNQVLINLLSNALKFTDKGEIALTAEELFHQEGESVYRFSVRDTGIGIDPLQAKKLFTSFTQASTDTSRLFGGTGLGLAISQNLVALLGGEIELETQPGEGSYFSFTIRVKAQEQASPSSKTPLSAKDVKLSGKHILVVDDIAINREIILALLEETEAELSTAEDGKQALDQFSASPIGYYDLIFMDLQMPIMDGYAATKHIRALDRPDATQVIIAAVSANALKEDVEQATQAGMNGYLTKPLDTKVLYSKVGEWL